MFPSEENNNWDFVPDRASAFVTYLFLVTRLQTGSNLRE